MFDPFQIKKAPQTGQTQSGSFALRDTAADSEMDKRKRRKVARAVKLLDLLTTDDNALHAYLEEQSVALAKEGQAPVDPFRPAQPQAEPADDMDALLAPPPPAVGTVDFKRLKAELLEQCKRDIAAATPPQLKILLCRCGLPGHCIHSITQSGEILHHYVSGELNTTALQMAENLLRQGMDGDFVEVYEDRLRLISTSETQLGGGKWIPL